MRLASLPTATTQPSTRRRAIYRISLLAATLAFSLVTLAVQPNDVAPVSNNLRRIGHADLGGRTAYQPTLHTIKERVYLFVGHFGGNTPSGAVNGGTTIVDVTDPARPNEVSFTPSDGSQMVRVCDGQSGVLGETGKYYMLRNTAHTHEVWDVTDPTKPKGPISVIKPATGVFSATHKNWWECETGVAYIVAGQSGVDGWTTNQHIKIYNLTDPTNPKPIRDIGLVGQNPDSLVKTKTTGVHGPISVVDNPVSGELVNRVYIPYGTSSNGVFQIVDRDKLLPPPWGHWSSSGVDPFKPTDAELGPPLVVGSMDMSPTEGAHTSFPIFNVPLTHYQGFVKSSTTRDLVALISEETDNKCTGAPHFGYLVDATRGFDPKTAASAAENHPMVISTMQVQEDSAKPDFCTRGTRFGPHSTNESFYAPYYGKLLFIAYFDGGLRVWDIRDPYHPQNVAYFIPNLTTNTRATIVNGVSFFDISTDNAELDDRGYIYIVDRVGGGADILELTGCTKQIVDNNQVCQGQ